MSINNLRLSDSEWNMLLKKNQGKIKEDPLAYSINSKIFSYQPCSGHIESSKIETPHKDTKTQRHILMCTQICPMNSQWPMTIILCLLIVWVYSLIFSITYFHSESKSLKLLTDNDSDCLVFVKLRMCL
jgi:hypothetical protein